MAPPPPSARRRPRVSREHLGKTISSTGQNLELDTAAFSPTTRYGTLSPTAPYQRRGHVTPAPALRSTDFSAATHKPPPTAAALTGSKDVVFVQYSANYLHLIQLGAAGTTISPATCSTKPHKDNLCLH